MLHLDKGIFLEDKNILLEWGESVEKLATDNGAKIIRLGDRTIVEWGIHTILDGLTLDLSNIYLLATGPQLFKKFNSIEHWTGGDKQSFESFELISKHLLAKFGEPDEKSGDIKQDREKCWVWKTNDVKITLLVFEIHEFRLQLKIEQN